MKKALLISILFCLSLSLFAETIFGISAGFKPEFYKGQAAISENDYLTALSAGVFASSLEDKIQYEPLGGGFFIAGYFSYEVINKFSLEVNFAKSILNGYQTRFYISDEYEDSDKYEDAYFFRTYSSTDFSLYAKYSFLKGQIGFLSCLIGPTISITDSTSKVGFTGYTEETAVPIQNKILYGISVGVDAGLYYKKNGLLKMGVIATFDFNNTYNPDIVGSWFSNTCGNKTAINVIFSYGLKL